MQWNVIRHLIDLRGQIAAIRRTQAVIEFKPDGTILTANENFLSALGYALSEVQVRHHRMFVDPAEVSSPEYARWWQDLAQGQARQGQFRRITKGGRPIWIQATYTPILGPLGRPFKVVKYATDVTSRHELMEKTVEACRVMMSGSQKLGAVATQLSQNASEAVRQAEQSAASGRDVKQWMESASSNSTEMFAAMQEISQSAAQSAGLVRGAVAATGETEGCIARLGESSTAINSVVELIHSIAQQTNLLALNATIEASRAGEAGRGFAVVADEVKQLARRTEEATRDISSRIQTIQADTAAAVRSITVIAQMMNQVDGLSGTIAAAVEEQTVIGNEISKNVQQAAERTNDISTNMAVVETAAQGAAETKLTATEMAEVARELDALISKV